jgi:hypothetical protein
MTATVHGQKLTQEALDHIGKREALQLARRVSANANR